MPHSNPTADNPTIEVSAGAQQSFEADLCITSVSVDVEHSNADSAFRRRTELINLVRSVLDNSPKVDTYGEDLRSHRDRDGVYSEHWSINVRCSTVDIQQLREVISRLAGVEDVFVNSIEWELSAEFREECFNSMLGDAVRAARRKAETLATAYGTELGGLIYLSNNEAQYLGARTFKGARMAALELEGAALPERTLELDLKPDRIRVGAEVTAEFGVGSSNL